MLTPLQITLRGVDHSDVLEQHIQDKAQKLGEFFDRIVSCRVVVGQPHKHSHQGKQFNVCIDIGVPGSEIVVNHEHADDVYVALRDAFDAATRQLEDYAHKQRGETKKHQLRRRYDYSPGGAVIDDR